MSKIVYQDTPLGKFRVGKNSIELKKYEDKKIHVAKSGVYNEGYDGSGFCDTEPVTFLQKTYTNSKRIVVKGRIDNFYHKTFKITDTYLDEKSEFKPFSNVDYNTAPYIQCLKQEVDECELTIYDSFYLHKKGSNKYMFEQLDDPSSSGNETFEDLYLEKTSNDIKTILKDIKVIEVEKHPRALTKMKKDNELCDEVEETLEVNYIYVIEATIEKSFKYYECPACKEIFLHPCESKACIVVGEYIFNNPNSIKRTIMIKEVKINYRNGTVGKKLVKDMTIFNKKTRKIYAINNFWVSGDKMMYHINKKIFSIKDITYSYNLRIFPKKGVTFGWAAYDNIFNRLVSVWLRKFYGKELKYTYSDLSAFHCEYDVRECQYIKDTLNIKNTNLAYIIYQLRKCDKKLMTTLKGKTEKEIFAYLKINKKAAANLAKNIKNLGAFIYGYKYIDNKDYVKKLIENNRLSYRTTDRRKTDFVHQYAKNNTEVRFFNQINSIDNYTLNDAISMYDDIIKNKSDYKLDWSKTIKELHDIMSLDYKKIRTKNQKIPQNKDMKKVFKDFEFAGIKYQLAKETHELVTVGSKMAICVGSYAQRAVKRHCIIVIGYKDEEPVTCIEINKLPNGYYVNQVKKRRNSYPETDEANTLIKLFDNNEMSYDHFDLRNSTLLNKQHNELGEVI